MQSQKISISLPSSLIDFIEQYKTINGFESRSSVIEKAVKLLLDQELVNAYYLANSEIDPDWEVTTGDGLADEPW